MELFLIRHAIAAPRSPMLPDAERPLTRQGRERFVQAVAGLQRLGIRLRQVHHSPWLRAAETAALLTPVLKGDLLPTRALACPPEAALLHEIEATPAALVGHEPWMRDLLAWLVTGSPTAGAMFAFKKGGVAWLEGPLRPGSMVLRAYLPPKVLRVLGGSGS
jgi:phosphohistidine phosphatase